MTTNKSNPINSGEVLVITCQANGSSNLTKDTTTWYKDGLKVTRDLLYPSPAYLLKV